MGQKVHPKVFRLGVINTWSSKWYSKQDFRKHLKQDVLVKKFVKNLLKEGAVSSVEIERNSSKITIIIHTAKPGIVIGRGGTGIEDIKKSVQKEFFTKKDNLHISIQEVRDPALSAELVMQGVIADIEKRMPFRRAMKQAMNKSERAGAEGVKIMVAGRLNGAEIARSEKVLFGKVPLHTLRADIDYARGAARTTYGAIGVKVWIYRGEYIEKTNEDKNIKK
jgi:small subunit ribosomal protein S3